jgi:mannan endo-1,4-beta-mannosidase
VQQAVDYWTSPAMLDVLQGEEAYILINIGNEPWGNVGTAGWTSATIAAIQGMRAAGLTHTLVVDAPNWGQDWQFVMRDNAPQVAAADVLGNTLFSIHMYEVFGQASSVISYFDAFESMGLPLVVGEFGHFHNGQNVDEDTIMAEAQARGIGYIGWSWSGNSGGVEFLDHVNNFNPSSLTTWGQRLFLGPDGIVATAQRASVFDDGTPSPPPPPPSPGECDVRYEANDWGGHPGLPPA